MTSHDLLGSHPCLVTNDWESLLPRKELLGSHYCRESYVTMTPHLLSSPTSLAPLTREVTQLKHSTIDCENISQTWYLYA